MQGMNLQSGAKLARAFYEMGLESASLPAPSEQHLEDGYLERVIAGTANIAFACELAMKNVIFSRGATEQELRTHGLEKLFGMLQDGDQQLIEHLTITYCNGRCGDAYGHEQFAEDLRISAFAFPDLRYWHEVPDPGKRGKRARVAFMRGFGSAVMVWMELLSAAR